MTALRVILTRTTSCCVRASRACCCVPGFEVVGQAGDPSQLLTMVRDQIPELVVVDIRMPPSHTTEGLDAAHVIRQDFPEVGILVLRPTSRSNRRWSSSPAAGGWLPAQESRD